MVVSAWLLILEKFVTSDCSRLDDSEELMIRRGKWAMVLGHCVDSHWLELRVWILQLWWDLCQCNSDFKFLVEGYNMNTPEKCLYYVCQSLPSSTLPALSSPLLNIWYSCAGSI